MRDLTKVFRSRKDSHVALMDVSLDIAQGESIGIVGESGSGKTTLARIIVGLERADSGTVHVNAQTDRGPAVGIVFQNPYSALNPARTIGQTLAEAASVAGASQRCGRAARRSRTPGRVREAATRPPLGR